MFEVKIPSGATLEFNIYPQFDGDEFLCNYQCRFDLTYKKAYVGKARIRVSRETCDLLSIQAIIYSEATVAADSWKHVNEDEILSGLEEAMDWIDITAPRR